MQRLSFLNSAPTRSARTRLARIGVATGVAGLSLFGTVMVADAQTTTTTAPKATTRTPLTQAQLDAAKACMTAKGFTIQTHDGMGRGPKGATATTIAGAATTPTTKAPKTAQSAEQRAAYEAAATACGLPTGGGHGGQGGPGDGPGGRGGRGGVALTDAQKACLTGKGITLPTKPTVPAAGANTTGTKPARVAPTDAERAARMAAEAACGIVRPTPPVKGTNTTPTTAKAV